MVPNFIFPFYLELKKMVQKKALRTSFEERHHTFQFPQRRPKLVNESEFKLVTSFVSHLCPSIPDQKNEKS